MEARLCFLTSDRVLASLGHNITFVLFKMLFSPQFTRGRKCSRLYWIISGLLASDWSKSKMALSDWLVVGTWCKEGDEEWWAGCDHHELHWELWLRSFGILGKKSRARKSLQVWMKTYFCIETCLKWIKIIFSFGDIYNIKWWMDPIIVLIVWNCDDTLTLMGMMIEDDLCDGR